MNSRCDYNKCKTYSVILPSLPLFCWTFSCLFPHGKCLYFPFKKCWNIIFTLILRCLFNVSFRLMVHLLNHLQVMEQFFGLVNTFLQNHRDTWKRRLGVRTYKVSSLNLIQGIVEINPEGRVCCVYLVEGSYGD